MKTLLLFSLLSLSLSNAGYASGDNVVQVTTQTEFTKQVLNSDELVLVEFYAPWCGHCKSLEPEWKKAASALKGIVKLVAVDADAHRDLASPYGVQGFPTIKFFGTDKKPQDYSGGRTAKDIVDFAIKEIQKVTSSRMGGKADSGGGGKQRTRSSGSESGSSGGGSSGGGGANAVVTLTASNFQELVLDSDEAWLVEFFAPWCGHCKSLAPAWEQAAKRLKGKVNLGAVDATVETGLAQDYGVRGYPTIKSFASGKKTKSSSKDYEGGRTAEAIEQYALSNLYVENVPIPEVLELTSQITWDKQCAPPALCVISVLPDILDTGASGRERYISILKKVANNHKRKGFTYVWTAALQQAEVEKTLGIGGFGYPALAVLNAKKQRSALMAGPFTEEGINNFLSGLLSGKEKTAPLSGTLPVHTVSPWDGKDGQASTNDDIDLSELGLNFNQKETVNAYDKEL